MNINARGLHFKDLNAQIRAAQARDIVVENCLGQRYIGSGLAGKNVVINGLSGRLHHYGLRQYAGGHRRHDERG